MAARVDACGKRRYPSPQAAWTVLLALDKRTRRKQRKGRSRHGQQRVYHCTSCGFWHLTAGEWGTARDQ